MISERVRSSKYDAKKRDINNDKQVLLEGTKDCCSESENTLAGLDENIIVEGVSEYQAEESQRISNKINKLATSNGSTNVSPFRWMA
jgi:Holliday junction resolvase RusA-like endonuclease